MWVAEAPLYGSAFKYHFLFYITSQRPHRCYNTSYFFSLTKDRITLLPSRSLLFVLSPSFSGRLWQYSPLKNTQFLRFKRQEIFLRKLTGLRYLEKSIVFQRTSKLELITNIILIRHMLVVLLTSLKS